MSATVDGSFFVEINQIHQHVVANCTYKAAWMPALVLSGTRRKHSYLPEIYAVTTSVTDLQMIISNVISGLLYDASSVSRLSFRSDPKFAANYLQTFQF